MTNLGDPALVRHIYDVWKIDTQYPESKKAAKDIFHSLIETDVHEFRGQNPEFDEDPIAVLRKTLKILVSERRLEIEFDKKLKPLLFSNEESNYNVCLKSFEDVATYLLD